MAPRQVEVFHWTCACGFTVSARTEGGARAARIDHIAFWDLKRRITLKADMAHAEVKG